MKPGVARGSRLERGWVAVACLVVGWLYAWTSASSDPWWFGLEQRDYYNLLIDGWLEGQLHMKVEVPAELRALPDPYDPRLRPPDLGLHDASYYQGKYYVYFGAAPVVLLMLPFRVLTGIDLPLAAAVLVFTYAGFLAMAAMWLGVRRRYLATVSGGVSGAIVLVLGLVNLGPVLLRRPHMWELPIAAGFCFLMLALGAVGRSLDAATVRARGGWFTAAGLALGLAIASRPTYLLASPLLAVPLLAWWRGERRVPWRTALAAVAPLAAIGAGMAWYNYARFGDPLQFGQAYQFSLDYESKVEHFSPRYLGFNTWRYFFSAAEWSGSYPFIAPAELPPKPRGFSGHDDVYGVLVNLPFAWLALAAPLALWRREVEERRRLGAWLATVAVAGATMAGLFLVFFGSLARYQVDFTPALMLLAAVGVLALERWAAATRGAGARRGVRAAWVVLAAFSAVFAVLFSLQMNRFLRHRNPAGDAAVARVLNWLPARFGWAEASGVRRGEPMRGGKVLRMTVALPRGKTGAREPLVTTGRRGQGDVLLVEYVDAGAVRFEVDHWGAAGWRSERVAVDFSRPVELEIGLPSLATPREDETPRAVQRGRVFVRVNDALAWAQSVEFYTAAADEVAIGRNPIGATSCAAEFSGQVLRAERSER